MGADVTIKEGKEGKGITPLVMAIFQGKVEIVGILLHYESDINNRDEGNITLLHTAVISGKVVGNKCIFQSERSSCPAN
jgi:ankyrin repeat protein